MATLLEKGIAAAKQGKKAEASLLFEQVLLADDRNERAWLWMSEVAETPEDQIACVEQVLSINPGNSMAQLALKKLKANPVTVTVPVNEPQSGSHGLLKTSGRKPFRLTEAKIQNNGQAIHHQNTIAVPIANGANSDTFAALRQADGRAVPTPKNGDSIPLMPALIFGTLLMTAAGGLAMIALFLLLG